jgi:hypothetical protein
MISLHDAIIKLNPQVTAIREDVAYDIDGNEVAYDKEAALVKAAELEANKGAVRQSAINKLMALGLTEEEALALGVK